MEKGSHPTKTTSMKEGEKGEEGGSSGMCHSAFPTGFWAEFKGISKMLPPVVFATCCQWYVQPIATMFAGHLGKVELDAIGLSCTLINILGYSMLYGMSGACDAAFTQTYGGNNLKLMGIYLQRCTYIMVLVLFPCVALFVNMEGLLLLLGQDPEVSRLCGIYLLYFIPGTFSMAPFVILQKYFQCQRIVYVDLWMGLVAHVLHAVLQYVLLYVLNWGIIGSSIAQASFYIFSSAMRLVYFFWCKQIKQTWGGWCRQGLVGWTPLAKIAFYGMVMTCAEWWAFEISSILAGLLGTTELAANTVLFTLNILLAAIPIGISMATMVQMGHQLGAGQPLRAKTTARIATVLCTVNGIFWIFILVGLRQYIGMIFTNVREVIDLLATIMPIFAVIIFFDSLTNAGRFIYRGTAKQMEAAILIFVSYYAVAVPLGVCLMFLTPLALHGLWLGFVMAVALTGIGMFIRYNWFLNWETISIEAQERACSKKAASEKIPDERTRLLSRSVRSEDTHPVLLEEADPIQALSGEVHLLSTTISVNLSMKPVPVSWRVVLQKVVIIVAVISTVLVGVIVRFSTAHLLPDLGKGYSNLTTITPTNITMMVTENLSSQLY